MNKNRCDFCGKYLESQPFYMIDRKVCDLKVWICPQCGNTVKKVILK